MKFNIRFHCHWSIVKCTGSKCLPNISVKQFAPSSGKSANCLEWKRHKNVSFVTSENRKEIFVNIASIISVSTGTSIFYLYSTSVPSYFLCLRKNLVSSIFAISSPTKDKFCLNCRKGVQNFQSSQYSKQVSQLFDWIIWNKLFDCGNMAENTSKANLKLKSLKST